MYIKKKLQEKCCDEKKFVTKLKDSNKDKTQNSMCDKTSKLKL